MDLFCYFSFFLFSWCLGYFFAKKGLAACPALRLMAPPGVRFQEVLDKGFEIIPNNSQHMSKFIKRLWNQNIKCFIILIINASLFPAAFIVNCSPPTIKGGFSGPLLDVYEHRSTVYYSCDRGLKPALYTWWEELRCSNGTWTPTPRCIGEYRSSQSRPQMNSSAT